MRRLTTAALAAGLLLGLAAGPGAAQSRSIVIEDMHAVYQVRENGDVGVQERFRVRFNGEWNGLERFVELRPPSIYGQSQPVGFRWVSTLTGTGQTLRTEVTSTDRYTRRIRMYVPDANDRTVTLTLSYTLSDVLGFYEANDERGLPALDEFYWQVTGTDWRVPIRRASAEVYLPDEARISQAAAYVGGSASTDQTPVETVGATARVDDVGPLDPGEGLTIGVGWPAGTVERDPGRLIPYAEPDMDRRVAAQESGPRDRRGPGAYWPLLLPLAAFWFGYRAWDRRGRDPKERSIMVRWEPPSDLSPAEAGTLVDHDPGMHDIISTLVELAVKGYIVIEEREQKVLVFSSTDYVFHLMRPWDEWDDLLLHQRRFLRGLFERNEGGLGKVLTTVMGVDERRGPEPGAPEGAVASVELSDLKNEFYKSIPEIKDEIFDRLVKKGHYLERPDKVRGRWFLGAGLMVFVGVMGFMMLSGDTIGGTVLTVSGFGSAIILGVFGALMPARTEKGARTREAALGFKRFLEKVENPRYKRMIKSPDQFEEYLPFAMAFQCQEEWAKAFDDLLTEPPDWYRGHHGTFHATAFASNMGSMASTASSAMASSPGGTGSGGGGSVGGGGGGGGGGGF